MYLLIEYFRVATIFYYVYLHVFKYIPFQRSSESVRIRLCLVSVRQFCSRINVGWWCSFFLNFLSCEYLGLRVGVFAERERRDLTVRVAVLYITRNCTPRCVYVPILRILAGLHIFQNDCTVGRHGETAAIFILITRLVVNYHHTWIKPSLCRYRAQTPSLS